MGVIKVREISTGRKHVAKATGDRTYTRNFLVLTDHKKIDKLVVRLAAGIPRLYEPYQTGTEYDLGCTCQQIDVDVHPDSPYLWKVVCTYTTVQFVPAHLGGDINQPQGGGQGGEGRPPNPLMQPPIVSWDSEAVMEPAIKDIFGDAVVNSALDPFDPPYEVEKTRLILTIERNLPSFSGSTIIYYKNTINANTYYGFEPYTVKVDDIKAKEVFSDQFFYWQCTFKFKIRHKDDPWFPTKLLDKGFHELRFNAATQDWEPSIIRDPIDDQPYATAQLLNGDGTKLQKKKPPLPPVYRNFGFYIPVDFTPLQLV